MNAGKAAHIPCTWPGIKKKKSNIPSTADIKGEITSTTCRINTGTQTTASSPLKYIHTNASELRSCMRVQVAALGSPSLTVPRASVDVKQH